MVNQYFVSIRELLEAHFPRQTIVLVDDSTLGYISVRPAQLMHGPASGLSVDTAIVLEHKLVMKLPLIDSFSFSIGGSYDPIELAATIYPIKSIRVGPCPVSILFDSNLFIPVRRVMLGQSLIGFETDPTRDSLQIIFDQCVVTYSENDGVDLTVSVLVSIPEFEINGTNLILGCHDATVIFKEAQFEPHLGELGFDSTFKGVYAKRVALYWLPEIQLREFDLPGIRLDFERVAIGNQGISFDLSLNFEVTFNDSGDFLEEETELLGHLFNEDWPVALESASGNLRKNIPQKFSIKTYLKVPFFDAIFSTYFSLAYQVNDNSDNSYETALRIVKESSAPIVTTFFDDQLVISLSAFSVIGLLSNQGFAIAGQSSFAINIFGFELDVGSSSIDYIHEDKLDHFRFSFSNAVLGEFGEVEEARLELKSHSNDSGERVFDKIEISAEYHWGDLKGLIPQDMQEILSLPEDGSIQVLINWVESRDESGQSYNVVVRLLTGVSHLDNLWSFVPENFRPDIRRVESVFMLSYASFQAFSGKDDNGDAMPAPTQYSPRAGVNVELSAFVEIRLPELGQFNLPGFDLIHIETGDIEGFITAEFKASYHSDGDEEEGFQAGLTIENPISVGILLPGADPDIPFIVNQFSKVGMQFSVQDDDSDINKIGGKILFEGVFEFRPMVPANIPFASQFNSLLRQVGLDDISGTSILSLAFTEDSFTLDINGGFERFGIELDIFKMLSSLSNNTEAPSSAAIDIDFDITFNLVGFNFNLTNQPSGADTANGEFSFEFSLMVECIMTGLAPIKASITLSNTEFSFGIDDLVIPLEIPKYPINNDDLSRLGDNGVWSASAHLSFSSELDSQISSLQALLELDDLSEGRRFRLLKDKANMELKKFMLQIVMAVHSRVGEDGQQVYQGLVEADTFFHDAALSFFHVDTALKLHFPEIKIKIPFDNPAGIAIQGTGRIIGFANNDPMKALEDYSLTLGLSSEYIFAKIDSDGEPIALPAFGSKYDDGSISISKFLIGYGYTKNSFAIDFAGELVLPTDLVDDANTSERIGVGVKLPRNTKLAFKIDMIPITIVKATVLLPIPRFDLDLRTPNAPAFVSLSPCTPYWDGIELKADDVIHADLKRIAFSPFMGMSITPNIKFDGDIKFGTAGTGLTIIADDVLVVFGTMVGSNFVSIPFFADPQQPYFENICINLRVIGFEINFNLQRPLPSLSPMSALEAFGLIGNPMMKVDPSGSLANTIRMSLTDAYLKVPDFVLQMFPDAANFVNKTYSFTLNLGTLIAMIQSLGDVGIPIVDKLSAFARGELTNINAIFNQIPDTFDPWDWIGLLPPELRKHRTGGKIAGFEASVCMVVATAAEALHGLTNKNSVKSELPMLRMEPTDTPSFYTYSNNQTAQINAITRGLVEDDWEIYGDEIWNQIDGAIDVRSEGDTSHHLLLKQETQSDDFSISFEMTVTSMRVHSTFGIVFCYIDLENYYRVTHQRITQSTYHIVVEKIKPSGVTILFEQALDGRLPGETICWELTTYVTQEGRNFNLEQSVLIPIRNSGTGDFQKIVKPSVAISDIDNFLISKKIGLMAKGKVDIHVTNIRIHQVNVNEGRGAKISASSLENGFSVNVKPAAFTRGRTIQHDERASLFKGIEFKQFDEKHLAMIAVDEIKSISVDQASIYLGAYINLFKGQRFRFIGRLFSNGSFSLVSEAESRALNLSVFGLPATVPFGGYGHLAMVGRQQRRGFWGYVVAKGYCTWSPIPNIVQIEIGKKEDPSHLKLYSTGEFSLSATADITLFNGMGKIIGSINITNEQAVFTGTLSYQLGKEITDYRFNNLLAINIDGDGKIEGMDKYRFNGCGTVMFLGEELSNVEVDVTERYATFAFHVQKIDAMSMGVDNLLCDNFPILSDCDIDLVGSCRVNLRRTVRPDFDFSGEGFIEAFGARVEGKGEVRSTPVNGQRSRRDSFSVLMDGDLYWQNRKWLGGKFRVGSEGLHISGSTNFGITLSPSNVGQINIASLFLNINLSGEFELDASGGSMYFKFGGDWALGALLPNTGSEENNQLLPLAKQQFSFKSSIGLSSVDDDGDDEYAVELLNVNGLSFLPFKDLSIPIPTLKIEGRGDVFATEGLVNQLPAIQFNSPDKKFGLNGVLPFIIDSSDSLNWVAGTKTDIYSEYKVSTNIINYELEKLTNWRLSLVMKDSKEDNFPIRFKLEVGDHTNYFHLN